MDLRSNLGKARGLGSAHEGSHHWLMQRVTAVALVPLVVWFVISVINATSFHGIDGVIYLLSSPFNAVCMILFLGAAIYHGTLGVKVVIEDYVHCPCGSRVLDILTKFVSVVSVVAVTFAIFYVHVKTYDNAGKYQKGFWHKPCMRDKNAGNTTVGTSGGMDGETPEKVAEPPTEYNVEE